MPLKLPVPVPFVVLLSLIVGILFLLQHIPREVTPVPPSFVTLPPEIADVFVISVTAVVFIRGALFGSSFSQLFAKSKINPMISIGIENTVFFFIFSCFNYMSN